MLDYTVYDSVYRRYTILYTRYAPACEVADFEIKKYTCKSMFMPYLKFDRIFKN